MTESNIQDSLDGPRLDVTRPISIGGEVFFLLPAHRCAYKWDDASGQDHRCAQWLRQPGLCYEHEALRKARLVRDNSEAHEEAQAARTARDRLLKMYPNVPPAVIDEMIATMKA